jgi:hypothetical protein
MWSKLAENDRPLHKIIADFIFNGLLGLGLYFALLFTFTWFSPTSWYFEYSSVEPVSIPVAINGEYIDMESTLVVNQPGELEWNDVLRCLNRQSGRFDYVGEYNTRSATVAETDGLEVSRWRYRGEMPAYPALCRMESTITRHLQFGIVKEQFIQSSVFKIE